MSDSPAPNPPPRPDPARAVASAAGAAAGPARPAAVAPAAVSVLQRQPANPARLRRRHRGVILSLVLFVLMPGGAAGWYLWTRAADQYASLVAFSVRKEEVSSAIELLGGITQLSGSSSSDTDILYEFIQSQRLVARIDERLDLRSIWSWPENDPVFTYAGPGVIEDLVRYWPRMVQISYDSGTGLMEVRTLAFRPEDATAIAAAIYEESSAMINELSDIAREDSVRYARDELDRAVERLRSARLAVTEFRNRTQIVDPSVDLQTQAGLLGTLQTQLAEALIDLDILRETAQASDPRITQAERRVRVIEDRLAEERRKLGIGEDAAQGAVYADLVGEYESLSVDREFAEQSYTAALASYDAAQAEARRKSRYLAAHILPTLAESAQYPRREVLLALISTFLFGLWSIVVLVYFSLKDRR